MNEPNFSELRDIASTVALAAAARIRSRRAELMATDGLAAHTSTKSSAVDPVTDVDTMSERFVADELLRLRPEDGLIGEEGASRRTQTGVVWVVDPIDGTVNFLYGIEEYAVSIGAVYNGQIVAGAVVNVAKDTVYQAALGYGATVTRPGEAPVRLACRNELDPAKALIATGFSYCASRRAAQAQVLYALLPEVRDIRRMGSAALDLCRVAEGTVDAYYEHALNSWDYVAGVIIAREAGALVHEPGVRTQGSEGQVVLAASGAVAPAFRRLLDWAGGLGPLN